MDLIAFIHELAWPDLPYEVRQQARRCLLDTLGAGIGGWQTDCARVTRDFVAQVFASRGARLWLDGREVSLPGAALANAMATDALDIHDGHSLAKGHAGATLVPAALATLSLAPSIPGTELLTTLAMGYEIALRAGMALHATSCDYHTSGAWNALGAAAVTARRLGLGSEATRHALGIAEYYGPRSQMMRGIAHPTMLKDGSGWGALVGVSAGLLSQAGFTGAPAVTVEGLELTALWNDLGERWHFLEQYFKPHPVCRWAQPAVEAALQLRQAYGLLPEAIARVVVYTFHHATRLHVRHPRSTEEAQYSLPFPVAAALVHGGLPPQALMGPNLQHPAVVTLVEQIEVVEDPALSKKFPAQRWARVLVETMDGRQLDSGVVGPRWEAWEPPTDGELRLKFRSLASGVLPSSRTEALEGAIWRCAEAQDLADLLALLCDPIRAL